ncbi:hypothetical protein [Desulfosporosinus meridiei]|uniref:Uncharacterized protein n=1 Tax=Desulfosporosinus meridiei (strain ATCC BAA-275 / DSM 13257 / KCTC 12902 / NCIMB 13706 / S10) TaxID=768704 RepID=J7ITC8_DESMD|nr:hypothetical protein [Desulfosporosinus meridiei]AFQ43419.1 hypothetical protein Desmer_1426 [Desulfosporosinus meridiei DSM 13257]
MNVKQRKWLNVLGSGLVGFNFGFVAALLLAQWTWLELRCNTGLAILVGVGIGLGIGLFRTVKHPLVVEGISLLAMLISTLAIADAQLSALKILAGYTIREGLLMPDLSLQVANIIFSLITLGSLLVAFVLNRNKPLNFNDGEY